MKHDEKIVDRQVGRNADMFARAIGEKKTQEERYPYIRILISIIEQAHPEWNQAPTKDRQISFLVFHMSKGTIDQDEVAEIVRLRDEERGYTSTERRPEKGKPSEKQEKDEKPEEVKEDTKPADASSEAAESGDENTREKEQATTIDEEADFQKVNPEDAKPQSTPEDSTEESGIESDSDDSKEVAGDSDASDERAR